MKNIASALSLIILSSFFVNRTGEEVLKKMYKKYAGKWYSSFTFTQTTQNYRNDSLIKTSTWYEALVYPDKFRIDFGDKAEGNAAIFSKDSVYTFRKAKLVRTTPNNENLTFLLGGMYFYSFDSVKAMVINMGYNIDKSCETIWENKKVYVIGASNDSEKVNQIWIDKEKLVLVKFIKYNDGHKEEGITGDHKRFGKGWSETSFSFFIDDKLVQKETYYDCKAGEKIDDKYFDTNYFILRK